jgi:hypothetical protein
MICRGGFQLRRSTLFVELEFLYDYGAGPECFFVEGRPFGAMNERERGEGERGRMSGISHGVDKWSVLFDKISNEFDKSCNETYPFPVFIVYRLTLFLSVGNSCKSNYFSNFYKKKANCLIIYIKKPYFCVPKLATRFIFGQTIF